MPDWAYGFKSRPRYQIIEITCFFVVINVIFATFSDAGWSSLVARRAHNPKVVGSNPAPATTFLKVFFSNATFGTSNYFLFSFEEDTY